MVRRAPQPLTSPLMCHRLGSDRVWLTPFSSFLGSSRLPESNSSIRWLLSIATGLREKLHDVEGKLEMIICDFCLQFQKDGTCAFGLNIPKRMGCRDFDPGIEKFCSNPTDFVSPSQIAQMAGFFGLKGIELKKVKLMAAREEKTQAEVAANPADSPAIS